jgi:two-component system, OmpR family, phosphate regulon sensor histidine kinase PhoR
MKFFSRFINPLMAFIAIQLLWVLVVIFWIYWFTGSHRRLRTLAEKYSPELLPGGMDWFILTEGLLLLVAILAGVYVIFLYWQRQAALYRAQRQFIAQVTHELKSPLASLQLHLQTIRMRRLPAKRLDTFVDTMLADTDRLDTLINNLLSANRLDQRGVKLHLSAGDFSEFTTGYFRSQQYSLPKAGVMDLEVEPGLHTQFEAEAMEMVFRNLLENAILYSEGPPRIGVTLRRDGKHAHLAFADQGKGLEKKDMKRIFRMFYRVRHAGETIRGSGLGLFIIQAVVRHHHGRIWVESPGLKQGTTFHLRMPLCSPPAMEQA